MNASVQEPGGVRRRDRIRPAAVGSLAVALAYGGGLWLQLVHAAAGHVQVGEPPALLHWLRDSTLTLPLIAAAVWLALAVGRRVAPRGDGLGVRLVSGALLVTILAAVTSLVVALAVPVQTIAFGAYHDHHGAQIPLATQMGFGGLVGLAVDLLIASVVLGFLRGKFWVSDPRRPLRAQVAQSAPLRRAFVMVSSAVLVSTSGLALPLTTTAVAAASGAAPCPASAPVKTFDVSAIDMKMWLDRFGDNDPQAQMYVLDSMIPAVRAQEAAGPSSLSIGLADDAMQPLAIRANEGDCVTINFTNRTTRPAPLASSNTYGLHIDGLAFDMSSSGDAIGNNAPSSVAGSGGTATYTFYIPNDVTLEGAHYIHPGPANRQAVAHGLFGTLNVEPRGSSYLDMTTGLPIESGWAAIIVPATGKSFRENVKVFHEIGNEAEKDTTPVDINGSALPTIDPNTGAYRPASRAINYRSEPFMDRLNAAEDQHSGEYSSYVFGDTTNIIPRGYLGDPTKFRLVHGGTEVFHVYHLHGGSDRWRFNPKADPTYDYGQTGLDKHPVETQSQSARLDSQTIGPGESYDLEIENGAGGAQQGAGEFLFHCHIAHHYFAGMWGYWRVYDTLQPDLMPLPDRTPMPKAVGAPDLIGRTIAGQQITASNLDAWIRPQLPTQGVTHDINVATRDTADEDASVWDWSVDPATGQYLGEPDRDFTVPTGPLQGQPWPDFANAVPGHPAALPIDQTIDSTYKLNGSTVHFDAGGYIGSRPKLLFDPTNGRPAFPMLRPHIGKRPPFSPNGHSGAPYLGEYGGKAVNPVVPVGSPPGTTPIDPWANRADGICPAGAPLRTYNVVGIQLPITTTDPDKTVRVVDPRGALDVLASDKDAVYAGTKVYAGVAHPEPLALRGNIGDCLAITYTSEETDGSPELPYAKTNIHIHHVQFDTQASDGVISGFSFEQAIRPYKIVDPQLTSAAAAGDSVLSLSSVAKFQVGVWIGVGLGTDGIEIRQIKSIDSAAKTVTLNQAIGSAHPADEWAGTEFVQYRWYPDVELDNIFFHDHVNGIHGWSHGMVGQLIIEPTGSRYFDPVSGEEIRAGAAADIHVDPTCAPNTTPQGFPAGTSDQCKLIPGVIDKSYREFVVWTINDGEGVAGNPAFAGQGQAEAMLNLRAEPFADRCANPAIRFDSSCGGDPYTPILHAYVGDPVVIRNINVGQGTNTLTIDGARTFNDPRYRNALGVESSPVDTIHEGVSERFTLILDGGAGGPNHVAGDYLYHDGENRRFEKGAWGILRVLPTITPDLLKPLPGFTQLPARLPTCPVGAPVHTFAISAVDVPSTTAGGGREGIRAAFVPTSQAASVIAKQLFPQPLVMHVAAGECVQVTLTNQRATSRASFHVGALLRDLNSSGINVGNNSGDQTIAPGATRTYTYYADSQKLESAVISDFGGDNSGTDGLYGSVVVAPAGATFSDPTTGAATDVGSQVDVRLPGGINYRDFTALLADHDPRIGQNAMPYPAAISGPAFINYRQVTGRQDNATTFSSLVNGDPSTPIIRAYAGDRVKVHALVAPASEQVHVFSLGGMSFPSDMYIANASKLQSRAVGPWEKLDAYVAGGAGGQMQQPGDYFYGDLRRPFTQAGMWGLFRVLPNNCASGGTPGLRCLAASIMPPRPSVTSISPATGLAGGGTWITITGTGFDTDPSGTSVAFGAEPSTRVNCETTTTCMAMSPAGTGRVDITVTTDAGTSALTAADEFIYGSAPPPPSVPDLVAASDSGFSNTDNVTRITTPTFTGTASGGGTIVSILVDGVACCSNPVSSSGVWTISTPALTAGTHAITARASGGVLTSAESAPLSVTIDTAAPTTPVAAVRFAVAQLGTTTLPVTVSWSASDPGSGISSYLLQRSVNGAAFAAQALATPTSTSLTQQLNAATQYRYRVQATDVAGNVSAFSAIVTRTISVAQENGSGAIAYAGTWTTQAVAGAFGGSVRFATATGATATYTFSGNNVAWVTTRASNRGIAQVRLDGVLVATVDLFAAATSPRQLVFQRTGIGAGTHTLQVRVTGTRNAASTGNRIDVDAYLRMN
jgi:hypothetical protein